MIQINKDRVEYRYKKELVVFTPVGKDGIRVRATYNKQLTNNNWALLDKINTFDESSTLNNITTLRNGKLTLKITKFGKLSFYNEKQELLLQEYYRTGDFGCDFDNKDEFDDYIMIHKYAREFSAINTGYSVKVRFKANIKEKIFGMGSYQIPYLNLKGCTLELEQVNTQTSVPFYLSSLGYGFLWNNPAIGNVTFGKNITEFIANTTQEVDFWVTAGDTPAQIEENYTDVTGTIPIIDNVYLGFWQSKLRYQTEEEVLNVAKEYKKRNIPISVIVLDFFHWTNQGDWKPDKKYWPHFEDMITTLNKMGIKLAVSVWPTVDSKSENSNEMFEKDLLIRTDRGCPVTMQLFGSQNFADFTNKEAQSYVFEKCKKNYLDKGVSLFWLDVAEPEYTVGDYVSYRYSQGPALECANIYPLKYSQAFYEGMRASGITNPINLVRSAWAGSQRYGALVWSGDVPSSFSYLNNQIKAGINMGIAGIPLWTCDIGGFHGGNVDDPQFKELLIRWFEFGTFCPVMRLHGDRSPHTKPLDTEVGGGMCHSGAPNEVYSYGDKCEKLFTNYINVRQKLIPYIKQAVIEANKNGTPIMKPLFFDFNDDEKCWDIEDEYLFGHDLLVAPIYEYKKRKRKVYLPKGEIWINIYNGEESEGGISIDVDAPIEQIPLFCKKGSSLSLEWRVTFNNL